MRKSREGSGMVFVITLVTVAIASGPAWAANSVEAQSFTLEVVPIPFGGFGLHFVWDYFAPELREGLAWVTIQDSVRVQATVEKTSPQGGLVRSRHPWPMQEAMDLMRALICGGEGTLRLKVQDLYCHEHRWEVRFSEIEVKGGRLYERLVASLCGESTWDTIPGGTPIQDIDGFLATCPSEDELAILERDFPILFQPPCRMRDPVYSCSEPPASMRELSDQLAIYQALRVIRHMRLSAPLPWTFLHPYDWLKSKIGAIVVSYTASYSHCCIRVLPPGKTEPAIAIVLQKADQELLRYRTVWRDLRSGVGLAHLILLVFHEARHVDLPHDCGDKDSTLSYMGAWGVQYTLAKMLSEGTIDVGLSPAYREDMAACAQELIATRFCEGE